MSVISATVGGQPGKKRDPISKITRAKRVRGMAQVIKCLPSKCEALSSNRNTDKKKKKMLKM
jgi:hypothetical protein